MKNSMECAEAETEAADRYLPGSFWGLREKGEKEAVRSDEKLVSLQRPDSISLTETA